MFNKSNGMQSPVVIWNVVRYNYWWAVLYWKGISWFESTRFSQINSDVKGAFDSTRERFEIMLYIDQYL